MEWTSDDVYGSKSSILNPHAFYKMLHLILPFDTLSVPVVAY